MAERGRVLVTGATGFIGRHVAARLERSGWQVVRAGFRRAAPGIVALPLDPETPFGPALAGCSAVVHLAGRAHVLRETAQDPIETFRRINSLATAALTQAAAGAGISRFVFVSSVAAQGGMGSIPLREEDEPRPATAYGLSKREAEEALDAIGQETGMAITVLRPPLVYGPEVGARFRQLLTLCDTGLPLPFGAVENARSFIGVENLVDAIETCLVHPSAAGRTYLVADAAPVSTPTLLRMMLRALGRPERLLPVPPLLLSMGAGLVGKGKEMERLLGSLVLNTERITAELDWSPPLSTEAGIARMVEWYRTDA